VAFTQLVGRHDGAGAVAGDEAEEDVARRRGLAAGDIFCSTESAWLASAPLMPPMAS
jgi:hypothetical protein